MGRFALIALLGLIHVGCAAGPFPLGYNTVGIDNSIVWRATNLDFDTIGHDNGLLAKFARQRYEFTPVLQETGGRHITFTHLNYRVLLPLHVRSDPYFSNETGHWVLAPYGELTLPPLVLRLRCRPRCRLGPQTSLDWDIELSGTTAQSQPIRMEIQARLPVNPEAPLSMGTTKLQQANLARANLRAVDFTGAQLQDAILHQANLQNTNLKDAKLDGARLEGANLSGVKNLSQAQLNSACVDDQTQLPKDLKRPKPCQ